MLENLKVRLALTMIKDSRCLCLLQEVADHIIGKMNGYTSRVERLLPLNAFVEQIQKVSNWSHGITNDDLRVLLVYLARDMGMIAYNEQVSLNISPEG